MADSLQANIPTRYGIADALLSLARAESLNVHVANYTGTSKAVEVFQDKSGVAYRYIQNQGTVPVKVMVGDNASADKYVKVLAACTGASDGKGGDMDLSKFRGKVSVWFVGAGAVQCTEATGNDIPA